jgi:two-component system, LytTR family, response regulator
MIRAIVIDDEINNLKNLRQILHKHCQELTVVGTALNADEGIKIIEALDPDLVFLDIQMPGKSGFEMLRSLVSYHFAIIFVTAYDQYGIQAIKFSALDYLLKPIDIDELKEAVQKAIRFQKQKSQNLQVENLLRLIELRHTKEEHRIALPSLKEIRFVLIREIVRCEASNNYSIFYFLNGEKIIVSRPIAEFEELLKEYGFLRPHKSHLVNQKFIKSFVKEDGGYLLLEDHSQLPISKQKKEQIKTILSSIKWPR